LLVGAVVLAAIVAATFDSSIHWRLKVLREKLAGQLPQIDWPDLVWMLEPGAKITIGAMGTPPNPYAVIVNPLRSPRDTRAGERLFEQHCAICHGSGARGGPGGPSLHNYTFLQGRSDWALYRTITHGVPGTAMAGHKLGRDNVWRLVAYLNSTLGRGDVSVSAERAALVPVGPDELLRSEEHSSEWLTYSGSYNGQRHSPEDEINAGNVGQLRVAWVRQLPSSEDRRLEVTPIVRGFTMYVTALPADAYALNAATGEVIWSYRHPLASRLALCCEGNRGVALLGNRVFLGTMDAHLIALDANDGSVIWDDTIADSPRGYAITAAPLAVGDLVITGVAGGDFATRGFLDAYDAASGKRRWRFYTIPAPDEPGGDSWQGESYRTGGGPTWMTGSYDPKLGLLYWGVGNPNPDFFGDSRKGNNLYTNSVVALELTTGKLRWYFQFTPHDTHDWDAAQVPVLVDNVAGYPGRKLLAWANRNGFFYLLDRVSGQFLAGASFIRQNWADGLDQTGHPRLRANAIPTAEGVLVYPQTSGATSWWPSSYDPRLQLLFVPTVDVGSIVTASGTGEPDQGEARGGSVQEIQPNELMIPAVKALDVRSGRVVWQHAFPARKPNPDAETGGLTSTTGGVVFGGDLDTFFALDARTGAELWSFQTGGHIVAAPITYELGGRGYVAVAAGTSIFAFSLPSPKAH
jgi:alcohol dehydrogenase (cytochrome c)